MKITQQLTLDFTTPGTIQYVSAKQGDQSSRFIQITLTHNGAPYTLPEGAMVKFRAQKPDGTMILNPAAVGADGTVTVELTDQTLAVCGSVLADLCITDSQQRILSTVSFVIQVDTAPTGDLSESSGEFLALNQLVTRAEKAAADASGKAAEAEQSSATAAAKAAESASAARQSENARAGAIAVAVNAKQSADTASAAADTASAFAQTATQVASVASQSSQAAQAAAKQAEGAKNGIAEAEARARQSADTATQKAQDAAASAQKAQQAANAAADKLPLAGGRMTGTIDMGGNGITDLPAPVNPSDAVPKHYVDEHVTLRGCRMLLVGNSYAAGVGGNRKGWAHYVRDYLKADCDIIHQNAGDFGVKGNSNATYPGKNYQEAIAAYAATKTEQERKLIRYVVFGGGWNDAQAQLDALDNAVFDCLNFVQAQFPNARIMVFPLRSHVPFRSMMDYNALRVWCNEAAHAGAGTTENSIYWFYGRPTLCSDDGIHLNDEGYKLCAKYIISSLRGCEFEFAPIPGSGFQPVPEAVTAVRTFRTADGLVCIQGSVRFEAGIQNQMNIVQDVGSMFRPGRSVYATAFFYGTDDAHKFAAPVCVGSEGWIGLRSAGHEYSPQGTIYLNLTYQAGL